MRVVRAAAVLGLLGLAACADVENAAQSEQAVTAHKCPDGVTIEGIDVSEYQASVDWNAVKASGRVFGIARINVGSHLDPYFQGNWAGMHNAGIIRGAYQYYKPSYDPTDQANLVVSTLGVLAPDDMPAMLDIETLDGVAPADVIPRLATWLHVVEAGTGKKPLIYTGAYFWDDNLASTAFSDYALVIPWYGTNCPGVPNAWDGPGWKFHQYSETGTVPGVSSNPTDLDVFNGSEDDLRAFIGPGKPCGVIDASGREIDDTDACFHAGGPAAYLHRVTTAGEGGSLVWTHATADTTEANFAEWQLDLATAGRYTIEVYTSAAFAQSKQAKYLVTASGHSKEVVIDQTAVDGWQVLGDFDLAAGGSQSVHLGDNTGEPEANNVQLVFDAVRLRPVGAGPGDDPGSGQDPGHHSAGCSTAGGGGSSAVLLLFLALQVRRTRRR